MQQVTVLYFGDVWDAEWRRRQQLAFQLSTMPEVHQLVFVEQPLPLTALAKYALGRSSPGAVARIAPLVAQRSPLTRVSEKVHVIASIALAPVGRFRPTFAAELSVYCRITSFLIRRVLDRIRPAKLVLWASYPPFLPTRFLDRFNQVLTWYDCTEDWSVVPELPPAIKTTAREVDRYLTRRADVVSVVSRAHWASKRRERPDAHWVPNGVDLHAFAEASRRPVPDDMSGIPRPRLLLIGNANVSQDWDLILEVLTERPQWSLVVVGPDSLPKEFRARLGEVANLRLLGRKPYRELPAYLAHADVCVQCYRPERAPSFESTTKTFLYLASGKPFVSYSLVDENDPEHLIQIVRSEQEFIDRIKYALASDPVELPSRRRELAAANTWQVRGQQIRGILLRALEHCS